MKSKCSERQEFVVVGYVPSTTVARRPSARWCSATIDDGELVHAGRVGTGFSRDVARRSLRAGSERIRPQDAALRREASGATRARGVRWVKPRARGRGRVPRLDRRRHPAPRLLPRPARGQARDARSSRETPPEPSGRAGAASRRSSSPIPTASTGRTPASPSRGSPTTTPRSGRASRRYVVGRPLALLRCPRRHRAASASSRSTPGRASAASILTVQDPRRRRRAAARHRRPRRPDRARAGGRARDPPLGRDARRPRAAGPDHHRPRSRRRRRLAGRSSPPRARCASGSRTLGLASFVKTSGGKGLHVVRAAEADRRRLGRREGLRRTRSPRRWRPTARPLRRHRSPRRSARAASCVDYLRNGRGATAVAAYSTPAPAPARRSRCRSPGTSSAPAIGPAYFTVENAPPASRTRADPWADFRAAAAPLPKAAS